MTKLKVEKVEEHGLKMAKNIEVFILCVNKKKLQDIVYVLLERNP